MDKNQAAGLQPKPLGSICLPISIDPLRFSLNFLEFSRILRARTGSRIFCQKNLRLDRVEKTSFGQRTELNADRDSTLGSLRWDPKTSCHWARRLAMRDQHGKMKSGQKVWGAPYKIWRKNFYFLQGHSAPPRNFCRALSEIQERRLERLERLRDETRAPGILLPLCLVIWSLLLKMKKGSGAFY